MQSDPMDDSLNNSHDCLTLRDPAVFVVNVSGTVEIDPNPDPDLLYLPLQYLPQLQVAVQQGGRARQSHQGSWIQGDTEARILGKA